MDDDIHFPAGFAWGDILALGNVGIVLGFDAVLKFPISLEDQRFIDIEREIYERLANGHEGLIRYYGPYGNGVILQRARNGGLRQFKGQKPRLLQMRWMQQIVESVAFIHSKGVLHGDISGNNVFLDENLNAKLGDFAGSSIDGADALVAYESRYTHPSMEETTVASDLFALGSMIYEILTGHRPYEEKSSREVEKAFDREQYPDLKPLGRFEKVVGKCWSQKYQSADDLLLELKALVIEETEKHVAISDDVFLRFLKIPSRQGSLAILWLGIPVISVAIHGWLRFRGR